ncbi:MAG: MFS transporter [Chloroflexota bacterium]
MSARENGGRKNLVILSLTLIVVMLGFGMVIPIIPYYMEVMGAGGAELGMLVASYAVMRLIFGPIWGGLSDRVGRKPVLMIGMLGYGIAMLGFGLATELWMLFLFRILSGILSSATSPTTLAYVSDSTSEKDRGGGMGTLGAAVGLGTIVGPGLGGWLAGDTLSLQALSLPFFVAAGLSFITLVLIGLFLPESLPAEARQSRPVGSKGFQPSQLWQALSCPQGRPIGILLGMAFLIAYASTAFFGIFGLYAYQKFEYTPQQAGMVLMLVGFVSVVAQGGLTGPFTRRWGEARLIQAASLATVVGFIAITLSFSDVTLLLSIGFFTLATALMAPAVMALTSKRSTLEQGLTMGICNSFMSLGRIVGPGGSGFLFDANMEYPLYAGALVTLLGFLAALAWLAPERPAAGLEAGANETEVSPVPQQQP